MNETPEPNIHRISIQQLDILIEYMARYPRLALATARSRESLVQSYHMWDKIARTLNKLDKNANKTGRGWARYWADRKFKARRKYSIMRKCELETEPCTIVLDSHDQKIIKIITDKDGNLMAVNSVKEQMIAYQSRMVKAKKRPISVNSDLEDQNMTSSEPEDVKPVILEDPIRIEKGRKLVHKKKQKHKEISRKKSTENKKTIEELRREMLEFELEKQKELFEIEKTQAREKHTMEMELLELKKQLLITELNNYTSQGVQFQ